jgi:hypothetical protein
LALKHPVSIGAVQGAGEITPKFPPARGPFFERMANKMRVNRNIIIGDIAEERIQHPQPRVALRMVFKLKWNALNLCHRQDRAVLQEEGLWSNMADERKIELAAALSDAAVT